MNYLLAVGAAAIAVSICLLVYRRIAEAPALLLVLAILFSAWEGGLGPALLCAALGAFAIDFWFIEPSGQIDLTPGTLLRVAVFMAIAYAVSSLTIARRRAADELARTNLELERRVAERTAELLEERNRVAREIHDNLAQGFTGILIQLEAVRMALDEPEEARRHIQTARTLARECLEEARRSVWAMRPRALEEATLAAAISRSVEPIISSAGVALQVEVQGEPRPLPPGYEEELLRIAQEATTNALRHGRPGSIRIAVEYGERDVSLRIVDDGSGFDVGGPLSSGFGMRSMRERAARIGGELRVTGRSGGGIEVLAIAPVAERDARVR